MNGKDSRRGQPWTAWLRWAGTLLSLALLFWLVSRQDWRGLLQAGSQVGALTVLAGLSLVAIRQLLNASRWYSLLRVQPVQLNLVGAIKLTFAGLFASNFLPTTIGGDVVRLAGVLKASEDKVAGSASLVADRLIGAASMLVFLPFGLPILSGLVMNQAAASAPAGAFALGLRPRFTKLKQRLGAALEPWRSRPTTLLLAVVINWLAASAYFLAVLVIARGVGISVTFWQVAGATALTYYLTLLPISINGYGLRELGVVAVYGQLGASTEAAAALALITRGLLWATSLPGALMIGSVLADRRRDEQQSGEYEPS